MKKLFGIVFLSAIVLITLACESPIAEPSRAYPAPITDLPAGEIIDLPGEMSSATLNIYFSTHTSPIIHSFSLTEGAIPSGIALATPDAEYIYNLKDHFESRYECTVNTTNANAKFIGLNFSFPDYEDARLVREKLTESQNLFSEYIYVDSDVIVYFTKELTDGEETWNIVSDLNLLAGWNRIAITEFASGNTFYHTAKTMTEPNDINWQYYSTFN
jgi:hypothetical protein